MPTAQRPLEHVQFELSGSSDAKPLQTALGQLSVILSEVERPRRVRNPREDDIAQQRNGDREYAVDDKQPSPPRHAPDTREVRVGGGLQVAADHGTQGITDEPRASAAEELRAAIPGPEDEVRAREHGRLEHADQESEGVQLVDVRDATLREGHDAPEDFEGWEEPPGQLWSRHEQHTRDLEDHVCCGVADVEVVQLISVEVEVLFQPAHVGITDICLIFAG